MGRGVDGNSRAILRGYTEVRMKGRLLDNNQPEYYDKR